jgi:hypothetical protein
MNGFLGMNLTGPLVARYILLRFVTRPCQCLMVDPPAFIVRGGVILVSVLIPKGAAKNIRGMTYVLRRSVVSVACPKASDNIWMSLPFGAQISVQGESLNGKRVSTVVCGG